MKTNTKKIVFGLGLALMANFASAQGLEGIVVEKFYQSNAADGANANANSAASALNTGSITYRLYVNLVPGAKFVQIFGETGHPLDFTTTTNFFNDPNSGSTTNPSNISTANVRKNTALLDTWLTTGGTATGRLGVLKTEDTDGSPGNAQGVLVNNPGGVFGLPINIGTTTNAGAADGMIPGTVVAPNVLGLTTELDVFDQTPGNSFSTTNGAIAALGGVTGATASNMVLIGQFTTDGTFGYHVNVQIINSGGGTENYYATSPSAGNFTDPSLTLAPNLAPTVSITAPANGANIITGSVVSVTATAADTDGTVSQVEFFVDNVSIGVDNSSPYSINWTSVVGAHAITAKATDDLSAIGTSTTVNVTVANNQAPTVAISAPSTAISADVVAITATASDADGTVSQVEFFVDNVSIGVDNSSPYSINWTAAAGTHALKATATDNLGLTGSSTTSIAVSANTPPTASITSPLATATYIAPAVVTIDATATDADGSVTQVEFFVNNVSIGIDNASPYTMNWTSVPGIANLTVKSTDNKSAVTTSAVVALNVADPNALPYEVVTVDQKCNLPTFCIPVAVAVTSPVDDIKGYDIILNYDNTRLTPTGNITVYNTLINASYVETANVIDNVNGKMNISLYFNGSAPANAEFNGTGNIFCVEFTKTGTFAQVDTADVSVSFLQESYISGVATKSVSAGEAITHRDENFDGKLQFWSDASPIKYDAAFPNAYLVTNVKGGDAVTQVINAASTPVNPDLTGKFSYNLTDGLGININRDVDNLVSVQLLVNAADAVLGKTLLLNQTSFTPSIYQALALDVNLDGVVSAGDISQIKQRATLNIPEYQQAWNYNNQGVSNGNPSKDWSFVDSVTVNTNAAYQISTTFPANDATGFSKAKVPVVPFVLALPVSNYANCPVIDAGTYKGIMLGDVDGSYATYTADGVLKSGTDDKIVMDLENATVNGSFLDVPVSVFAASPVKGLDLAFQFNQNKVVYSSVENVAVGIDGFAFYNTNDRTFRYTADNMNNFEQNKNLFSVRFNMINGKINETDMHNVLGLLNGKVVNVEYRNSNVAGVGSLNQTNLVSLFPNPSTGQLNVLSKDAATVHVMDITGQKVLIEASVSANEKLTLDVSELASGTYMVKIYNSNFSTTERVVIVK